MDNVAEVLHLEMLDKMKKSLTTLEEVYREQGGRDSPRYIFIRRQIMDAIYNGESSFFIKLAERGLLQKCSCGSSVRNGYNYNCDLCHGCGWINSNEFNEFLDSI
jgi:hypothetical protein